MNEFDIVEFSTLCDRDICDYLVYMHDCGNKHSVNCIRERLTGSFDTILTLINCMENKNLARCMEDYLTKKRKEVNDAYVDALNVLKTNAGDSDESK